MRIVLSLNQISMLNENLKLCISQIQNIKNKYPRYYLQTAISKISFFVNKTDPMLIRQYLNSNPDTAVSVQIKKNYELFLGEMDELIILINNHFTNGRLNIFFKESLKRPVKSLRGLRIEVYNEYKRAVSDPLPVEI